MHKHKPMHEWNKIKEKWLFKRAYRKKRWQKMHVYGKKHHSMSEQQQQNNQDYKLYTWIVQINIRLNILFFVFFSSSAFVDVLGSVRPCNKKPIKTWYEVINSFECKTIDSWCVRALTWNGVERACLCLCICHFVVAKLSLKHLACYCMRIKSVTFINACRFEVGYSWKKGWTEREYV